MCNCIEEANKALASKHMALTTVSMLLSKGKKAEFRQVLTVPVHSTKKGVKAKVVPINFCPLCGAKAA
jgi:hypothetical protein